MQIPVLVEPVPGTGYRARTGPPLDLTAEGATDEAAIEALKALLGERITNGTFVSALEVPAPNPWLPLAGDMADDPMFDEWQEAIQEYRRQVDAEGRWA